MAPWSDRMSATGGTGSKDAGSIDDRRSSGGVQGTPVGAVRAGGRARGRGTGGQVGGGGGLFI